MSINLTDRAELVEVIAVLVDAMRRSDPEDTLVHGCEPCSDDDWNTAIQAGEDAIEANETNVCPDCHGKGGTAPNGVQFCNCDDLQLKLIGGESERHVRVITGTGNASERRELDALCRALRA